MDIKISLRFLRWLFIILSVGLGGILGLAQTKTAHPTERAAQPPATAPVQRWHGGQKTITDAAGRVHVRHERITYTQRKAAAQRRVQAMRQAAARNPQGGVKK